MKPGYQASEDERRGKTGVPLEIPAASIGEKLTTVPPDFRVHRTIQRFLDNRRNAIEEGDGDRLGDGRGAGLRHAARGRP